MRISGVNIPDKKRLEIGLTAVYGVGRPRALEVLQAANVNPAKKPGELSEAEEQKIRELIEKGEFQIEGDLRREVGANIKRLKDIMSRRGVRHSKNMTVRGQSTKRNFRTVPSGVSAMHKGRKTMGSGRRKVEKK